MARTKGRNGKPKRLYLNEALTANADQLAFTKNLSLSAFTEDLYRRALAKAARAKGKGKVAA